MESENTRNPECGARALERTRIEHGNIVRYSLDAIVNAANESLLGGGGVDGAIHRAAGPELRQFCSTLGGCEVGQAKSSPGYMLSCRYIIHTVGPVWQGGTQDECSSLAQCYTNSLKLAVELGLKSVAFPAISCGVFGFPIELAAKIAVRSVASFLSLNESIEDVVFVCFGDGVHESLTQARDAIGFA